MKNGLFTWNWASLADAAVMAAVAAAVAGLVGVATSAGFNVFTADWKTIGESMVNLAFVAGVVSLGQDFISTSKGSILGITPETTPPQG